MRTTFPSASKKQLWMDKLWIEVERELFIRRFMGTDENNVIQVKKELTKVSGNTINFFLGVDIDADPIVGDEWLEGRESEIGIYADAVTIDRARQGTISKGAMDQKGSGFNFASISKTFLKRWLRGWIDKSWFRVLSGDTSFTFATPATAPTTNRQYWGGDATSKASISNDDWLGTYEISRMKHMALEADPKVPPLIIGGQEHYVMFIGRNQHFQMVQKDSVYTTAINAAYNAKGSEFPMISGAVVDWDGVLIYVSDNIMRWSDYGSTNNLVAERAILCGAQAGLMALGGNDEWKEKDFDYGDKPGHALGKNIGFKKAKFTGVAEDYGVICIDTFAPNPVLTAHT